IAWWISRPDIPADELAASPQDRLALRLVARRSWSYFETFVTAQDNMLPPDNFQEDPKPVTARRTSPTNIGLYLLSVAGAREFGWIGLGDAIGRIEATFATLRKMERCRAHLYNWYETETLRPLEPKYVSTVDSGNLAGHLLALANIGAHWAMQPAATTQHLDGIGDAVEILREEISRLTNGKRGLKQAITHANEQLTAFRRAIEEAGKTPELIAVRLIDLAVRANAISETVTRLAALLEAKAADEALRWADLLREAVESQFRDSVLDPQAVRSLQTRLAAITEEARELALGTEFGFLLNPERNLLAIGYRVNEAALDENCYDMLASEASLASFFAIAKGDVRARHWFRLARPVTALSGG
ncbi:MAG: protein ndvB, partial [Methylocella sp.]